MKLLISLLSALLLTSCIKKEIILGNNELLHLKNLNFVVNQTTKDEIMYKMGSPTAVDDIGSEKWIYIVRKMEKVAFFSAKPVYQKAYLFEFDGELLTEYKEVDLSKTHSVAFSRAETPSYGDDMSISKELFSNFGRFNVKRSLIDQK